MLTTQTTSFSWLVFGTALLVPGCGAAPGDPQASVTEQAVTGSCSSPIAIHGIGDQPQATTAGQPSSTDIDNSLSHNASDWTTDIGCSDVVYQLTGAGTTVTLTLRPVGSDWNGVLYARSASQGCTTDPYAPVTDASERTAGASESISFVAQSGVVYYVSVAGYGGAGGVACASGSFVLNVAGLPAAGGNGTCASPFAITGNGDQAQATTAGKPSNTDVDNALSHNASDWTTDIGCSDVVYQLTGTGSTVTLATRPVGSDWNAVLYARSASQGCATDPYAAITDGSERTAGASESISFVAQAGVDYYVSVGGYGVASSGTCSTGSFILDVSNGDGPPVSYGQWAYGAPPVDGIARAGFTWFNTGYPGTVSASDNTTLRNAGVLPVAYINASGVPQDDSSLQDQINQYFPGSSWNAIDLHCPDAFWNVANVDVRDSRWQNWLIARANTAYSLGNRAIFWDQARVENLCYGDPTAAQQAVDALGSVMTRLRAQHSDLEFIVNQGFAVSEQYTSLVSGLLEENLLNYYEQNGHDQWSTDEIAHTNRIRDLGITILDLEYIDLMGCDDTTCSYATQLINEAAAMRWVPYVTRQMMNYEGRGLTITPPW
jgi:endo-alpha-1,4-polygalactosaminidase (GH114 family)